MSSATPPGLIAPGLLPDSPLDTMPAWRRRTLIMLPYVLLAFLIIVTVSIKHSAWGSLRIDLALCGLSAAWILGMFTLRPAWWQRPRIMAVFVAGLIAVLAVLVVRDPWFGFFSPVAYVYTFALVRWPWRLAGVAAVAIVAATAQTSAADKTTAGGLAIYFAAIVINVVPMCGLAWFLANNQTWHVRRSQMIDELSEANRKLEATTVVQCDGRRSRCSATPAPFRIVVDDLSGRYVLHGLIGLQ